MNIKMKDTAVIYGNGPKGTVCLIMVACGIGDDLSALPAVSVLASDHDVTVYVREFHRELWSALPVHVVTVAPDRTQCDNGELLDMAWDAMACKKFERIYKLSNWAGWEDDERGSTDAARFDQFANIIGVAAPNTFSFHSVLKPLPLPGDSYTVIAGESAEHWRSLGEEQSESLYAELSQHGHVVRVGDKHVTCGSWHGLVSLIFNAERVIAVDTGIAHLAAALGKPLLVLGGFTDVRDVFAQYIRYNPREWTFEAVQGTWGECLSPCYRMPERGFLHRRCCGRYSEPKCIANITTEEILFNLEELCQQ